MAGVAPLTRAAMQKTATHRRPASHPHLLGERRSCISRRSARRGCGHKTAAYSCLGVRCVSSVSQRKCDTSFCSGEPCQQGRFSAFTAASARQSCGPTSHYRPEDLRKSGGSRGRTTAADPDGEHKFSKKNLIVCACDGGRASYGGCQIRLPRDAVQRLRPQGLPWGRWQAFQHTCPRAHMPTCPQRSGTQLLRHPCSFM